MPSTAPTCPKRDNGSKMPSDSNYQRPDTLAAALRLIEGSDYRVAAGCTDLFPATERKILPGSILDITGIEDLRGVSETKTGMRIGATTTWSDIIKADLPPAFDGLKRAAREVGATQIQNRGTIAGNLCNASPAADGVPPLLTLDAHVELQSAAATRQLRLQDFLTGPRKTQKATNEILTAIHIPREALKGSGHFLKLGARRYLVISIAMAAARLQIEGGVVRHAAISIGSCGPVATRLPKAEAALTGHPLDPSRIKDDMVLDAIAPIDDIRADAGYRMQAAAELVRRCVQHVADQKELA